MMIEHDTSGVAPARSVKCSQRLSAHVLKQRKIKKKKTAIIRNAMYLECFENALNWELVKIDIAVAS
jgi:hypothetical protein